MRTNTLFKIGGCSGSFCAPTENRAVFDAQAPWGIRREPFHRDLYGSRTSCYFLRHRDTFIVIDNGLGVEPLSEFILDMLAHEGKQNAVVHCLQTHYHQDHIEGIRGNSLFFQKDLVLRFFSPNLGMFRKNSSTLTPGSELMEHLLENSFSERYWPVTLEQLNDYGAQREHEQFFPGQTLRLNDITAQTISLNHPGGCTGFRFEIPNIGDIVIATDYEPPETPNRDVVEFFDGAKLLLCDMQYRDSEYAGTRPIGKLSMSRSGWGHGTPERVLPTILECKQRPERVRMVHHDPKRSDMDLRMFYEETVNLIESWNEGSAFNYRFGHDGDIFWF